MNTASGSGGRQRPWWRSELHGFWRWVGIVLAALLVAYIALVVYRIPAVREKERSAEAVAAIQAQHLTMNDVDGVHLPPPPDAAQVNATVVGVDVNGNGIRDDVELAIFAKYPGEANKKIRAGELQYARAVQTGVTTVFSTETWVAASQEEERALACMLDAISGGIEYKNIDLWLGDKRWIKQLMLNNESRQQNRTNLAKYEVSFALLQGQDCDLSFAQ